MNLAGVEIDERVRRVVEVLNQIPGVTTDSSCGGHANPTRGQHPDGTFSVDLYVPRNKHGWAAIELLAEVCMDFHPDLQLTPWVDGGLRWDLTGTVDPDEVAESIDQLTFRWRDPQFPLDHVTGRTP